LIQTLLFLACGPTLLVGFTEPITKADRHVMKRASYVCKTQYNKCVQKIVKREELNYHVVCGRSLK